jgi:hypothetical protein
LIRRSFDADYCGHTIGSMRTGRETLRGVRRESLKVSGPSSFGEGAAGELYAVSLEGRVYRPTG